MKTMKELRQQLIKNAEGLIEGSIEIKLACELNNTAGKIINTVRTQLEYAKLRKEKPEIDYLKCK